MLVAGGCRAAGHEAAPPSTTPKPSTTGVTVALPDPTEQAVLSDYLAGWDALVAATRRLDANDPGLADLYRDPALAGARRFISGLRTGGSTGFDHLSHRARVASVVGSEAVVFDCTTDESLVRNQTGVGRPAQDNRRGYDNRLRLEDGRWRTYEVSVFGSACL